MQYAWNVLAGAGQAGPLTLLVAAVQFASPHAYLVSSVKARYTELFITLTLILQATATGLAFSGRAIGGAFGSAIVGSLLCVAQAPALTCSLILRFLL
jgi:hypothetical protein